MCMYLIYVLSDKMYSFAGWFDSLLGGQWSHANVTTVCLEGDEFTQMFEGVNAELKKGDNSLWANKLSLNRYKTAFMIDSNKNKNINVDIIIIRDQDLVIARVRSNNFWLLLLVMNWTLLIRSIL